MKIELVMTVWEDGKFRLRDRIEADDFDDLKVQFALTVMTAEESLSNPSHPFIDDDIPF